MCTNCEIRHAIHRAAVRLFSDPQNDRVTVQDLAEAAGVPSGTIFRNVISTEALLEAIAGDIIVEARIRVLRQIGHLEDPAEAIAVSTRMLIREWSQAPDLGRFLVRHAISPLGSQSVGPPDQTTPLVKGVKTGRFLLREDQMAAAAFSMLGLGMGALRRVLDGEDTWQEAGSTAAEFVLVSLGILRSEARFIARRPLPPEFDC